MFLLVDALHARDTAVCLGTNAKKFEGDGLPFKGKLIGMEDLSVDRDEKICLDSMFKLKAVVKARGEHKQRIQLNLTMNAVKVTDDTTKVRTTCSCRRTMHERTIVCLGFHSSA